MKAKTAPVVCAPWADEAVGRFVIPLHLLVPLTADCSAATLPLPRQAMQDAVWSVTIQIMLLQVLMPQTGWLAVTAVM